MGNYLNEGFHLFVDNFYTSFGLIQDLYRKQTFLTGTIRRNRKNLPNDVKRKFSVGEKKYYRSDYILTLAYREKSSQSRPVILVSSDSQAIDVQTRRTKFGFERIKNKPKVIDEYNRYMGGIDTNDMMLYAYLDERRTVKFWKKVVFNVFGRMVLNSYILYKLNCLGKPMTRYQFVVSIIRDITEEWLRMKTPSGTGGGGDAPDNQPAASSSTQTYGIFKLPGKQEKCCAVCSKISLQSGGKMKRSRTACVKCNKGLHGVCLTKHVC
ncbi:piggyBac transposable element-derived protein 4-like [Homalodisca vitripennis]|uniref:piggyBac transposable element-derived protein 4-like n=1 Tax=Homalodisca vitripennis TaxID=197043 RepID=UPI001EECF26F|nr:piggyBac transposable element-derived protein 4-like [Homalodisca vitripennis]